MIAFEKLKRGTQKFWRRDECVAMHLPITHELRFFKSGDESKDALLLGIFQVGLKANKVEQIARKIILSQLNDCVRPLARARVFEAGWPHRTEHQRIFAALGDDFHGQTALEEMAGFYARANRIFERAQFNPFGSQQSVNERIVFVFGEWTIDVIAAIFSTLIVTRGAESDLHVDALARDNRCDGVEEIEMLLTAQFGNFLRERGRGQGA